jgi:hypothetical protein
MPSISLPTAAVIAAGVTAAGSVAASTLQSSAASKAAGKANATQQAGLDQARADIGPWSATGGQANTASADILGLNGPDAATAAMGNFQTSPGYQFSLDQGLRAVDAGAAAKGMLRSGATLKAEQTFGTGLADQEFTNYYNRLFDLSKLGENAAGGTAQASTNAATGQAQTDLSLGGAQTSIYGNVAQGIGNAANNYANNSLYADRTNALMGGYNGNPGTLTSYPNPAGGLPYYSSSNPNANW